MFFRWHEQVDDVGDVQDVEGVSIYTLLVPLRTRAGRNWIICKRVVPTMYFRHLFSPETLRENHPKPMPAEAYHIYGVVGLCYLSIIPFLLSFYIALSKQHIDCFASVFYDFENTWRLKKIQFSMKFWNFKKLRKYQNYTFFNVSQIRENYYAF